MDDMTGNFFVLFCSTYGAQFWNVCEIVLDQSKWKPRNKLSSKSYLQRRKNNREMETRSWPPESDKQSWLSQPHAFPESDAYFKGLCNLWVNQPGKQWPSQLINQTLSPSRNFEPFIQWASQFINERVSSSVNRGFKTRSEPPEFRWLLDCMSLATLVIYNQLITQKCTRKPQGPHSHILMTGGSNRGSYFIPKKIPTSEFVYPKKSLLFLAYPKKSLSVFTSANFISYLLES